MKPFVPALLLFILIIGVAPAIGHLRDFIFDTFPETGIRFLATGFAVVAAGFFVLAIARIRERRWLRYSLLLLALGLLWVQTVGLATSSAKVNVVEKFHILEYGGLAFLLYRAGLSNTRLSSTRLSSTRLSSTRLNRAWGTADPALLLLVFFAVTTAGTIDEGVQWLVPQRTGDIRDVALNATAGLSGLLFGLVLMPPAAWSWRIRAEHARWIGRAAAMTVLVLGLFFCVAHLSHVVEDPEIGQFRSRFTAEELLRLSAERTEAWRHHPPTGLATWAFEDYFLTEAAWHAEHRNSSQRAGNPTLAWLANRILEKYYDPFLDIDSFRGSGQHRYTPKDRQDLEQKKRRHDPRSYMSPVAQGRLFPGSKPLFLAILGVVVSGLWVLPGLFQQRRRRTTV